MVKAGVVIVNWNRADDTIKCVRSVKKFIKSARLKIVVVDNGSKQAELRKLEKEPGIILLKNKTNIGYARANNQGARTLTDHKQKPEYLLLLNNDAFGEEDFLKSMLDFMSRTPDCGSISPLIYYAVNRDKMWFSGGRLDLSTGIVNNFVVGKETAESRQTPYAVGWTNGCCVLVKTKTWLDYGGLDESLEMYCEDVEYSLRLLAGGLKAYVDPRTKVFHAVSASSGGKDAIRPRYMICKNQMRLAKKYRLGWAAGIKMAGWLVYSSAVYQSPNKMELLGATVRGIVDGVIS